MPEHYTRVMKFCFAAALQPSSPSKPTETRIERETKVTQETCTCHTWFFVYYAEWPDRNILALMTVCVCVPGYCQVDLVRIIYEWQQPTQIAHTYSAFEAGTPEFRANNASFLFHFFLCVVLVPCFSCDLPIHIHLRSIHSRLLRATQKPPVPTSKQSGVFFVCFVVFSHRFVHAMFSMALYRARNVLYFHCYLPKFSFQ